MLMHNNCFSVFRSLEFAFLCLKMLENASLRVKNNTLKSLCFKSLINKKVDLWSLWGVRTLQLPLPSLWACS